MANIEKAIASKLTEVHGRSKNVTSDARSYAPSDKRGRSASNNSEHVSQGEGGGRKTI